MLAIVFLGFPLLHAEHAKAGKVQNLLTNVVYFDLKEALKDARLQVIEGNTVTLKGSGQFNGNFIIESNLTLEGGLSSEPLILDGNHAGSVVTISTGTVVKLENLTIQHGHFFHSKLSTSADGGGIQNNGNLTLSNVTVTHNKARSAGGGIYTARGSHLQIINDSKILTNTADQAGGGIYMDRGSTLAISKSKISHNTSSSTGGGIEMNEAEGTISDSTISHNSVPHHGFGGAIYAIDSTLIISHSTFIDNTKGSFDNINGIFNQGGTVSVDGDNVPPL